MVVTSFVILALMAMVPEPVAAFHESDSATVQAGEYLYFSSGDLGSGSSGWKVTYSVSVRSYDPNFDTFLMTTSEFSSYQSGGTFNYISDCSVQNTHVVSSKSCTPLAGSYVLVFDNSNQGSAYPSGYEVKFTYTVDTSGGSTTDGSSFLTAFGLMCVLIIVIIVVVIIAVIVVMVRRRNQPVQPAYNPPPQQPYYQQPQPMYQPPPPPPMDPYQQQYQQPPPPPYGGGPGYGSPPPPPYR
jgi:hypothetical protein